MLDTRARIVGVATVGGPLALLGPAFVAAIAYIDPGNFATNITAGSAYGYLLLWVLVVSNLMAMLIQYLSAKAGIATGRSLPELCRDNFSPPVTRGLWLQAELVAIATDLAEVLGGAVALRLLFGLPLLVGGVDHRGGGVRAARSADQGCPTVRGGDHGDAPGGADRVRVQPGDRRCRRRSGRGRTGAALVATVITGLNVTLIVLTLLG